MRSRVSGEIGTGAVEAGVRGPGGLSLTASGLLRDATLMEAAMVEFADRSS